MRALTADERHALAIAPLPPIATRIAPKSWAGVLSYDAIGGVTVLRSSGHEATDRESNFGDFHVLAGSIQPRRGR